MKPFNVHILAADHTFYDGECVSLIVPTVTGMYGIHAGHSNMISAIVPGMLSYQLEGEEMQIAAISPGIMKIENGEVLVLSTPLSGRRKSTLTALSAKPTPRKKQFCKSAA